VKAARTFEFPPEEAATYRKAVRLEAFTVVYVISAAAVIFFTMGGSQAMRTAFFDDVISLTPALAFLVASRFILRPPSRNYPYGFHGAVSIGYLTAALALTAMGLFLLIESVIKFAHGERTTIGGMALFGHTVWAGWPMLGAVLYTSIPTVFLGRAKLKLAPKIHDKILFADADMMKADWMVGIATAIGVLGVGAGYWWVDPLAAALVSLDIIRDGGRNVQVAVADLMQRRPRKTDASAFEPLPTTLLKRMRALEWVEAAEVRARESGHVFFAEVFVVPRAGTRDLTARIEEAIAEAGDVDWRIHDVTVTPLKSLNREAEGDEAETPG
jgi:divalent metal cation (Fe/Co/Zn/Cd) transporter